MVKKYVPERGDVVWVTLDYRKGHEQKGRRPMFVLSAEGYNAKTHLAVMCPVTSQSKGYPFEVACTGRKMKGSILVDQMQSLDWTARNITFIEHLHSDIVAEVQQKVLLLIMEE